MAAITTSTVIAATTRVLQHAFSFELMMENEDKPVYEMEIEKRGCFKKPVTHYLDPSTKKKLATVKYSKSDEATIWKGSIDEEQPWGFFRIDPEVRRPKVPEMPWRIMMKAIPKQQ